MTHKCNLSVTCEELLALPQTLYRATALHDRDKLLSCTGVDVADELLIVMYQLYHKKQ